MSIQVGTYAGNGAGALAVTIGFRPDVVFLIEQAPHLVAPNHHTTFRARCRLSNFAGTTFGAVLGVARTGDPGAGDASFGYQGTTEGITSLDANGFTASTVFNTSGRDYAWVAMTTQAGEIAIGTYAGNGIATNINIGFDAEVVFIFNRATATADQHSTWQDRQLFTEGRVSTWVGGISPSSLFWDLGPPGTNRFRLNGAAMNRVGENYEWLAIARSGNFTTNRIGVLAYQGDNVDGRNLAGAVFQGANFTPAFVLGFKETALVVLALGTALAGSQFNQGGSIETIIVQENTVDSDSSPNNLNTEEGVQAFRLGGITVDAGGFVNMNESGANDRHTVLYFLLGAASAAGERRLRLGTGKRRLRLLTRRIPTSRAQ